jgi:Mn-dependent DtxR family transcriptional regulator
MLATNSRKKGGNPMIQTQKRSQSLEDYLESVFSLSQNQTPVHRIDVAKKLGVSGAAVNKAMKILFEQGLLYEDGKHLFLTADGQKYAQKIYERHCLLRDFLLRLGVSAKTAEDDACLLEHAMSEETYQAIKKHIL